MTPEHRKALELLLADMQLRDNFFEDGVSADLHDAGITTKEAAYVEGYIDATRHIAESDALRSVLQQGLQPITDNFGSKQLLADVANQCHTIDIRIRLNGAYYWFEGDYLKHILPNLTYRQIDNDGIKATLESHLEPPEKEG